MSNLLSEAQLAASKSIWVKSLFLAPKSFSFAYIRYRVLRPVLKGYYKLFNLFNPGKPWTTPASIMFFEKVLNKQMIGLEYGSGRSTVYFATKLKKLVSIEHHAEWYGKVEKLLADGNLNNVEYLLIQKQLTANNNDIELMNEPLKFDGSEPREEYFDYYNKVKDYSDNYFDFVLIDGRARVKCGLNAINKLKDGGIFVLDNSEREGYLPLVKALESWPKVETTTGLTNTTIWLKP